MWQFSLLCTSNPSKMNDLSHTIIGLPEYDLKLTLFVERSQKFSYFASKATWLKCLSFYWDSRLREVTQNLYVARRDDPMVTDSRMVNTGEYRTLFSRNNLARIINPPKKKEVKEKGRNANGKPKFLGVMVIYYKIYVC